MDKGEDEKKKRRSERSLLTEGAMMGREESREAGMVMMRWGVEGGYGYYRWIYETRDDEDSQASKRGEKEKRNRR
jgi:hypothetical protein